ncbi:DNA cytosine methyltransferase [Mucilaginibacter ginsenosidivorans]|uniref:Cytosine-specific methyltransferase n=1 Tax=Mucilaginibacter ginsenosidivorans TaxID=398053 RepID=A0A5B8UTD6_9SPHI|nr:DNA cytosine methyltransferase [Mucilaginibacter ginsenosidivorans]QEC61716.1 DNA cytosine methyltransferase [Mucilaginibacter ginsenosidivorans]
MVSVVSLFSGCGGLDLGFHDDFFKLKAAYDNDAAAVKCLQFNLKVPSKVLDVTSEDFNIELGRLKTADIVLGGFPCQGFSKAGPKNNDDPRNQLYLAMLKAVDQLNPAIFIGENVDGLAQNFNGSFVDKIIADFGAIGYNVEYRILNAVNYGVPQFRRRIIFIGTRKSYTQKFSWPNPSHYGITRNGEFKTEWDVTEHSDLFNQTTLKPAKTIKAAIEDLLEKDESFPDHKVTEKLKKNDLLIVQSIKQGQKLCNVRFSDTSVYTWQIPSVFGETTERERKILETIGKNRRKKIYGDIPNGNPLSIEVISDLTTLDISKKELDVLVTKKYLRTWDSKYDLTGAMFCSGLYKRPSWNEPSPTVLTVFHSPRYLAHPLKVRPFTIRECARLQSFPDDFKFLESGISVEDSYRLIGNAVPPLLAKSLSNSVKEYFTNLKNKHETHLTTVAL